MRGERHLVGAKVCLSSERSEFSLRASRNFAMSCTPRSVIFLLRSLYFPCTSNTRNQGQIEKTHTLDKKFFSFAQLKTFILVFFRISSSRDLQIVGPRRGCGKCCAIQTANGL